MSRNGRTGNSSRLVSDINSARSGVGDAHYNDKCAPRVEMSESRRGIRRFIQVADYY
jgi:hypothetical protein